MSILYKYLEKKGIKSRDDLNDIEKNTFNKWEKILSKELKMEDLDELMGDMEDKLQKKWLDMEDKSPISYIFYWKEQMYIKARLKNLSELRSIFVSNENNKKSLENYLKDLLSK